MKITIDVPDTYPWPELAHLLTVGWGSKHPDYRKVMEATGYGNARFSYNIKAREILMEVDGEKNTREASS